MGKLALLGRMAMALMPEPVVARLISQRDTYRGAMIDPKAYAVGMLVEQIRPPEEIAPLEEGRQTLRDVAAKFDKRVKLARVQELTVKGADGSIAARLYSDKPATKDAPALVYFHGGGFIQGDIDSHHHTCAKLAKYWGGTVISVAYRLAPEHPFPAAPDDCIAAFQDIAARADELGLDARRIGVGGDSAGGCLAAVAAQQLAAAGGAKTAFQVLAYPVVDATLSSASVADQEDAFVLPAKILYHFRDSYAGGWDDFEDPKFSPLFGQDFAALPPTHIITAGFDPLVDDGAAYAEKLRAAGVDVTYRLFSGQIHGFISLTKLIPQGQQALHEIADWLKRVA